MKILDTIADAIWAKLDPHIVAMRKDVNRELDEWQVIAQQELDDWREMAKQEIAAFRTEGLAMLKEALPDMAGQVAEKAVQTVFDNTEIDEATNDALGIVRGFFDQFRAGLGQLGLGGQQ
jgi:F0F1-type ATP synthase membrane subunit b/b'